MGSLATASPRSSKRSLSSDVQVSCGISFYFDFNDDRQRALEAYAYCLDVGVDAEEPEQERESWRMLVRVDLLTCDDLDGRVALIDSIAQRFGGVKVEKKSSLHCEADSEKTLEVDLASVECIAASTAYRVGKYREAAEIWDSLGDRQGLDSSIAWYAAGRACLAGGDGIAAQRTFEKLINSGGAESPFNMVGKLGLAWSLLEQGKTLQAEFAFLDVLESPWQPIAQFGLGCCRAQERDYSAALGWLKLAFRAAPHLKYECVKESSLAEMREQPEFASQMEPNWWNRLLHGRSLRSKWRGYEEFVDQVDLMELY